MKRLTLLSLLLTLLLGVSFAAGSKVVLRSNAFLKINDAYLLYSYPTAPYLHGGRMMASLNSLADMARLEPKYSPGCAQATLTSVDRIVTVNPEGSVNVQVTKPAPQAFQLNANIVSITRTKLALRVPQSFSGYCDYIVPVSAFARMYNFPLSWDAQNRIARITISSQGQDRTGTVFHVSTPFSSLDEDPSLIPTEYVLRLDGTGFFLATSVTGGSQRLDRFAFAYTFTAYRGGIPGGLGNALGVPGGSRPFYFQDYCIHVGKQVRCNVNENGCQWYNLGCPLYGVDGDPGRPPTLETWLLLASKP